jgi:acyl-CoA thioesterase FadM
MTLKFKRSARLGDLLDVVTTFRLDSAYRGRFSQRLECSGVLQVQAEVDVVCLDAQQQLREFPALTG